MVMVTVAIVVSVVVIVVFVASVFVIDSITAVMNYYIYLPAFLLMVLL